MAVNRIKAQLAYGIGDALIPLAPLSIIAVRNPATSDRAELGTKWINTVNDTAYLITSIKANVANWALIT